MEADFSEFTYGYALTYELINHHGLRGSGAPTFPSLSQEGQIGYDVKLPGKPIFLQFKLSEHMIGANAADAGLVGVPHYRMRLRRRDVSDQHQLLIDLEQTGAFVYYASPEFHRAADLNQAFDAHCIAARTSFWSPMDIGPLQDNSQHRIVFVPGLSYGYFRSEPSRVPKVSLEVAISGKARPLRPAARMIGLSNQELMAFAASLIDTYLARAMESKKPLVEFVRRRGEERSGIDYLSLVSQTLFGCLVLFQLASDQAA